MGLGFTVGLTAIGIVRELIGAGKIFDILSLIHISKKMKGLYFAGEVLDLDAVTGGYNLQIAWSTGYLAGIKDVYKRQHMHCSHRLLLTSSNTDRLSRQK